MSTTTQIPPEEIIKGKKIGSGAYSDVFFGNWKGIPVAIKELKSFEGTSPEALEKEASLLTTLKHPNIVAFHGLIDKTHHFVFAFIANGSLYNLIIDKSTATWKIGQRLSICKDMTKGLSYLHSQKVIHRDFKSPNVLIDEHFRAVISDFGISKLTSKQSLTQTGGIGTLAWMAPEQFEPGHYNSSVDIYALGLVIWEVFEEKKPFANCTIPEIMVQKMMEKTGEEFTNKTPEKLQELLKNCWKKPDTRPTANEILQWLQELENKQAIIEAAQKGDLETLEKLIALEKDTREPIAPSVRAKSTASITSFGAADWDLYFGDVGIEPALPSNIETILKSPCPFWPGQKVEDTHFLCLIPQSVNGNPLTLDSFQELVKQPKQGSSMKYSYYVSEIQREHGTTPIEHSYWVLMTKDVIPGSRYKSYEDQKVLLKNYSLYEMPRLIEAIAVIFMHNFKTEEPIYTDDKLGKQWTYTRCLEKPAKIQWSLVVGGLSSAGLSVSCSYGIEDHGIAGIRKLAIEH